MATFGLVHGGAHGAWCWERLTPELEALGHRVLTVDLPAGDRDAGAARYAEVALDAFAVCPDPMVIVGHSLGGLTIPLLPARRPVARLVFLNAIIPRIGMSAIQQNEQEDVLGQTEVSSREVDGADDSHSRSAEGAIRTFYNDLSREDAVWAANQLVAQSELPGREITPLTEWPDVPSSSFSACATRR